MQIPSVPYTCPRKHLTGVFGPRRDGTRSRHERAEAARAVPARAARSRITYTTTWGKKASAQQWEAKALVARNACAPRQAS